jgi:hypothetical protein
MASGLSLLGRIRRPNSNICLLEWDVNYHGIRASCTWRIRKVNNIGKFIGTGM